MAVNVDRLKTYMSKLVLFPRKNKAKKGDTARKDIKNVSQNTSGDMPEFRRRGESRAGSVVVYFHYVLEGTWFANDSTG